MNYTNNLIPVMTSNTTPSGVASASDCASSTFSAFYAFNHAKNYYSSTGILEQVWQSSKTTGWLCYEFNESIQINKYAINITNISVIVNRSPKNWTFEGSNDGGTTWIVLDTQTNITNWVNGETKNFVFENKNKYEKYRINVSANNGGATLVICELEMMGIENKTKFLLHDGDTVKSLTGGYYTDDLTKGQTYSGGLYSGYSFASAFDDNPATIWYGAGTGGNTSNDRIIVDFGVGNEKNIQKVTLLPSAYSCNTFKIQYSDDGTSFTDAYSGACVSNTKGIFEFSSCGKHRYWAVFVATTFGGGSSGFNEIEMMEYIPYTLNTVNTYPPTENDFLNNGMDTISGLYTQGDLMIAETVSNGETLGNGKIHKYHVKKSDMWSITGFECKDS